MQRSLVIVILSGALAFAKRKQMRSRRIPTSVRHRRPREAFLSMLHVPGRRHHRPAELARRLKTTPQEVNRLTNVQHTSRIDGIAAALKALGKRLDMCTV